MLVFCYCFSSQCEKIQATGFEFGYAALTTLYFSVLTLGLTYITIMYIVFFFFSFLVDSSIYSSKHVKRQIEELGLLVKLAFVGPNLEATVRYLETKSKA